MCASHCSRSVRWLASLSAPAQLAATSLHLHKQQKVCVTTERCGWARAHWLLWLRDCCDASKKMACMGLHPPPLAGAGGVLQRRQHPRILRGAAEGDDTFCRKPRHPGPGRGQGASPAARGCPPLQCCRCRCLVTAASRPPHPAGGGWQETCGHHAAGAGGRIRRQVRRAAFPPSSTSSTHPPTTHAIPCSCRRIHFDDLHHTGIFTWEQLHRLGQHKFAAKRAYLRELRDRGLSRDPSRRGSKQDRGGQQQQQQQQQK